MSSDQRSSGNSRLSETGRENLKEKQRQSQMEAGTWKDRQWGKKTE